MTKQEVIDFLLNGFVLSNLPDSFLRLQRIANDPHSDVEDVVAVVRMDPELAANLLKLANSSCYSTGTPVNSIEEAAQLLGMRAVVQSSLALGIISQIDIPHEHLDLRCFWKRCVSVAVISEKLHAKAPQFIRRIVDSNQLYTAGLLYDIGILALIEGFPSEMVGIIDGAELIGESIQEAESRVMGFTHQDVGRILFKKWGLSESLQCVAGYHHDPLSLKRRIHCPIVDLVHIADYICCKRDEGTPSSLKPRMLDQVWERSGISRTAIEEIELEVPQVFTATEAILSL
ncbi:HDOD domain-containing protein [Pelagicoccus albus]|uniref:HDOD domain-containing protein n=1 Tax=Pelagicoccus albus TaxID=415222 RepID=A0A7X1B715_9BACT|nr:HDOD domain-containing protein [Pelagicoccus albus]MBC2605563.1 HDOD domain-containing protein [Pelagicoccus albus]